MSTGPDAVRRAAAAARSRARAGGVRLADLAVVRLGDGGFPAYAQRIRALPGGRGASGQRMRTRLLALPSPHAFQIEVPPAPVAFTYCTAADDDLNYACRDGFRTWEPVSRHFFALAARKARVIVDVGAYSGVYSIVGALANAESRVLAFEPNPAMYSLAARNLAINGLDGRVKLSPAALAAGADRARLFLPSASSMATLVGQDGQPWVEVQSQPLDDACTGYEIDLMKVDVEGGEPAVLLGARATLARCHPVILMEALTQGDLEEQRGILGPLGYHDALAVAASGESGDDDRNYAWTTPGQVEAVTALLEQARAAGAQR